jgi:hypothetical protein
MRPYRRTPVKSWRRWGQTEHHPAAEALIRKVFAAKPNAESAHTRAAGRYDPDYFDDHWSVTGDLLIRNGRIVR